MIELAAIFCTLIGNCREVSLIYSPDSVTPMQCMIGAQPELAKWAIEHPGFSVKRWSCRIAGRYAKA